LWIVAALVTVLLTVTLAWDMTRPAEDQWTARAMLAGIDLYQATLSPVAGKAGVRCRFEPTCSHYAEAVIRRDGALVGGGRATWRVLRCGPWTSAGTVDQP
jgi:putative membrane protein insertion efficiency factor